MIIVSHYVACWKAPHTTTLKSWEYDYSMLEGLLVLYANPTVDVRVYLSREIYYPFLHAPYRTLKERCWVVAMLNIEMCMIFNVESVLSFLHWLLQRWNNIPIQYRTLLRRYNVKCWSEYSFQHWTYISRRIWLILIILQFNVSDRCVDLTLVYCME